MFRFLRPMSEALERVAARAVVGGARIGGRAVAAGARAGYNYAVRQGGAARGARAIGRVAQVVGRAGYQGGRIGMNAFRYRPGFMGGRIPLFEDVAIAGRHSQLNFALQRRLAAGVLGAGAVTGLAVASRDEYKGYRAEMSQNGNLEVSSPAMLNATGDLALSLYKRGRR